MSIEYLNLIRKEGENLSRTINNELFSNYIGGKRDSDLHSIFEKYRDLFEKDLFFSINELNDSSFDYPEARNLILSFLSTSSINFKSSKTVDKLIRFELREKIISGNKKYSYRSILPILINEEKKGIRDEIQSNKKLINQRIIKYKLELFDTIQETSQELEFKNYRELYSCVQNIDDLDLEKKANNFLSDSKYIFKELLKWFLQKKTGLPLGKSKIYDILHLLNSFELKGYFSKFNQNKLIDSFTNLDFDNIPDVDSQITSNKIFAPHTFPISPPTDIKISILPIGTISDYESLLYSFGKSFCFLFVDRDDTFETRYLRETGYTELFAQLIRGLVYEQKWLKKYINIDVKGDFAMFLNLRDLFNTRYCASMALYELSVFNSEDSVEIPSIYKEILENGLLCAIDEEDFVFDFNNPIKYLPVFNALTVLENFRNSMREKFDYEWWRNPESGKFFSETLKQGGRINMKVLDERNPFIDIHEDSLIKFYEQLFR